MLLAWEKGPFPQWEEFKEFKVIDHVLDTVKRKIKIKYTDNRMRDSELKTFVTRFSIERQLSSFLVWSV